MGSDTVLAYLAGVIDSDGYIGVARSTYALRRRGDATQAVYQPRIQIKQVQRQAVDLALQTFGGHLYQHGPGSKNGKPLWAWAVHSAACGPVLRDLLPHLRIKHDRALNALRVCEINQSRQRRRFPLPDVDPDEPMVTMAEAARRLGKDYGTVIQSVRLGNVPHIRLGPRKVFIPESYLPIWAGRAKSAPRRADLTAELDACYLRAKELNRVGV